MTFDDVSGEFASFDTLQECTDIIHPTSLHFRSVLPTRLFFLSPCKEIVAQLYGLYCISLLSIYLTPGQDAALERDLPDHLWGRVRVTFVLLVLFVLLLDSSSWFFLFVFFLFFFYELEVARSFRVKWMWFEWCVFIGTLRSPSLPCWPPTYAPPSCTD